MNFAHKINHDILCKLSLFRNQLANSGHKWPRIAFFVHDAHMAYNEFGGSLKNKGFEVFVIKAIRQ
jgi:hypothetical protein